MKTILTVAVIAALVGGAAWAIAWSKPSVPAYQVEIRDVAGASGLVVVPDVVAAAPAESMMPEVVVTPNLMPEVVVHGRHAPEFAATTRPGIELVN